MAGLHTQDYMTVLQTNYDAALHDEIRALAKARNAVILAHNYERP